METIQIQTPPKDTETDTPPETSDNMETFEIDERPADDEDFEEIEAEPRPDEIIVEDKSEEEDQNGEHDGDSSLSSAPGSDIESEGEQNTSMNDTKAKRSRPTRPEGAAAMKLGEIEGIKARLDKRLGSDELLKVFHRLLYKRPGTAQEVKKNIRNFPGFNFTESAARQSMVDKVSKLFNTQLKEISALLGLQVSGTKDELVHGIVDFLNSPWDTKVGAKKSKRRSSGKASKPVTKKRSTEKINVKKRKAKASDDEEEAEKSPRHNGSKDAGPPKKKAKATTEKKPKPKAKPLSKVRVSSPVESSDDDVPLRPAPSDADVKLFIREFLKGKDLANITKGMVKEVLRSKFGDDVIKNKRETISKGIEEGMEG